MRPIERPEIKGLTLTRLSEPVSPVSVNEFIDYAKLGSIPTTETALIESLLLSATELGENYTSRAFSVQTYRAEWEQAGGTIELPVWPVISVQSVTVDGEPVASELYANDLVINSIGRVVVNFTAGYPVAPSHLRTGVLKMALTAYENREDLFDGSATVLAYNAKTYFSTSKRIIL
jgi:hypothetical protein